MHLMFRRILSRSHPPFVLQLSHLPEPNKSKPVEMYDTCKGAQIKTIIEGKLKQNVVPTFYFHKKKGYPP